MESEILILSQITTAVEGRGHSLDKSNYTPKMLVWCTLVATVFGVWFDYLSSVLYS